MLLHFNPQSLPRTMTRQEWKAAYRWVRETNKRLKVEMDKRIENMLLFGTSHPEIYDRMADEIVNPPLMLSPWSK